MVASLKEGRCRTCCRHGTTARPAAASRHWYYRRNDSRPRTEVSAMRRRRWLIVVLALCAALGLGVGAWSSFFGRIGPQPDGTGVTPNHWLLTPAGLQVELGDRPLGIATAPDGRYLVISNNGQGEQSLVLFDTTTQKVIQTIPYSSPEALFLGIAITPDGRRVYASAGGNNKIRVYDFDGRAMAERAPIPLGEAKAR